MMHQNSLFSYHILALEAVLVNVQGHGHHLPLLTREGRGISPHSEKNFLNTETHLLYLTANFVIVPK